MKVIKINRNNIEQYAKNLGWLGKGTKDEPFIIKSIENLSNQIWIKKTELYIHLKDCKFNFIWLIKSQNITIENCIGDIYLHHCSNIKIIKSNIPIFKLSYSFTNKISKCSIDYVDNFFSRGNEFKDNNIPNQFEKGIIEGTNRQLYTSIFKLLPMIFLLVVLYLLTSDYVRENPILMITSIFGMILLGTTEILLFVPHYRTISKIKNYPPNLI